MLVNNNYKFIPLYTPKIRTAKNLLPQNVVQNQINELPNIYYQPIFTSQSEDKDLDYYAYDSEYLRDLPLYYMIADTLKITDDNIKLLTYLDDIGQLASSTFINAFKDVINDTNKDNIDIVILMVSHFIKGNMELDPRYGNPYEYNYYASDFTSVMKLLNKDNKDITKHFIELLPQSKEALQYLPDLVAQVNETTYPLINYIRQNSEYFGDDKCIEIIFQMLKKIVEDNSGIEALKEYLIYLIEAMPTDKLPKFPEEIIKKLPMKMAPEDINAFKYIYNSKLNPNDIAEIFNTINKDNFWILKDLKDNKRHISAENIICLLKVPQYAEFVKMMINSPKLNDSEFVDFLHIYIEFPYATYSYFSNKLCKKNFNPIDIYKYANTELEKGSRTNSKNTLLAKQNGFDNTVAKINKYRNLIEKNPERYLNAGNENFQKARLFGVYLATNILEPVFALLDDETLDVLHRKRYNIFREYYSMLNCLDYYHCILLKKAYACNNEKGNPLKPQDKLDLIDLLYYYGKYYPDGLKSFENMISKNRINLTDLKMQLIKHLMPQDILHTFTPSSDYSREKIMDWDVAELYELSITLQKVNNKDYDLFKELISIANSYDDFKTAIQSNKCSFYEPNQNNKQKFEAIGLDYDKWLNMPQHANVHFISKDKNTERIEQIVKQLTEDIEVLRTTPAKNFVDKQLNQCIQDDKVVIPKHYYSNKDNLIEFIKGVDSQLTRVWTKAKANTNNPNKHETALQTLTIKDHLNQRIEDTKVIEDSITENQLDYTIKMWDRKPQKDLFQGNYSTCCIGMNNSNARAVPTYLMNTAFNMIEIIDNTTDKTIGNALCYFNKSGNQPKFVIDNIEIRNGNIPSGNIGIQLRNAITEYAKNICKEVAGKELPIYLGSSYNDVPCDDLCTSDTYVDTLGDIFNIGFLYRDATRYLPYILA